jgi:hypothetical protein
MSASDPDSVPETKTRRKRKTKAEKEAELAEKMAEEAGGALFPPEIWMILGAALLFVAACVFLDPIGFAAGPQPSDQTILHTIIVVLVDKFGKNPVSAVFGLGGALSLVWGIVGWLRKRSGAGNQ